MTARDAGRDAMVSIEIAAPVDRVWPLVCDITVMPRFSTELQWVEWLDPDAAPALGARFRGVNRHPAIGEWSTTSQVTEFDPPRRFGWAVGDPEEPAATWCLDLAETATGSRLRYTARLGPGRSGVTMMIARDPERAEEIIAGRLAVWRTGMETVVGGIKRLAEADG